ncbi:MAG TPA: sodium:proton antiporter [Tepidisphaeraceae bacterium]|jgi:Na+/H+ antiporter NhaD/arsenite permease-like protein|nr:sodium:proton antiporter [Tepidisphaeraceae bacterium]
MLFYLTIPFVVLLAAIALMPFIHRQWWEHHYGKVSVALAAIVGAYYLFAATSARPWIHSMVDYVSFIVLLGSLYVVSGGIVIGVGRKATPLANSILLLFGAVMSNVLGTTGASMLLIRPFLRMNKEHLRPYHVVFFIFIVSNAGGLLTPIGDPPLFLGYLRGVSFWWNLDNSKWVWVLVIGLLLAVFFVLDALDHKREERKHPGDPGPAVHIVGIHNFLFIGLIVWGVFQMGLAEVIGVMHREGINARLVGRLIFSREMVMLMGAGGSLVLTGRPIYERNTFSWGPIREVALMFFGLFSTMVPALQVLGEHAGLIAPTTPGQYYFATGGLSAVLDNAPTYMAFLELELGRVEQGNLALLLADAQFNKSLLAISLGAVLFGGMTYIGNGPNFMVKSIADASGAKTPGFVGYVLNYSLPILCPIYLLVWLVFLR